MTFIIMRPSTQHNHRRAAKLADEKFSLVSRHARAFRHVFVRPVAPIPVETVAVASRDEKILAAVAVEIEHGGSRRHVLSRDRDVARGVGKEGLV